MKTLKKLLSCFLALTFSLLTILSVHAAAPVKKSLQFHEDGKFTIMVATDIHQSYYENDADKAKKTADMQKLLRAAVKESKPDLVVYDGDNAFGKTAEEMRVSISRIITPVSENNIPFTVVFGNHDEENGISLEEQLALYQEYSTCLMADPVPALSGCATNNLLIKNSSGTKDVFNLWLMDSGNKSTDPNIDGYGWMQDDQIAWYEQTGNALKAQNGGKAVPSLLFQHIPVPEIYNALRPAKLSEMLDSVKGTVSWAKGYYVAKDGVTGYLGEGPCPPTFNNGQFASWKKQGDILGAFFGHDHSNDFVANVDGIQLGYCKTAGFVPYGDGNGQAVRIITLNEKDLSTFDTHMLTFKQLRLKSESIDWFNRTFTNRQQIKLYAGLGSVVLWPVVLPVLTIIKHLKL